MLKLVQIGLAVSTLRSQLPFFGHCKPPCDTGIQHTSVVLRLGRTRGTELSVSNLLQPTILENGQSSFIFCCIGPQRALACNTQLSSIAVGVVIHCPIPCCLPVRTHCSCIVLGQLVESGASLITHHCVLAIQILHSQASSPFFYLPSNLEMFPCQTTTQSSTANGDIIVKH